MRTSFERAISRDSHNWFSRTQLAVALANQGDWQAAARSVQTCGQLNPREPVIQQVNRAIRLRKPLRAGRGQPGRRTSNCRRSGDGRH